MKILKPITIFFAALFLVACGDRVQVPPATVGKILTPQGYQPEIISPSVFRMKPCFTPGAICNKLVIIDASDRKIVEAFKVYMPKDELYLNFDMNIVFSILNDEKTLNAVLDKVEPVNSETRRYDMQVPASKIYDTYGRPVVRDVVRSVIANFTIEEVASNREGINAKINQALAKGVKGAPLSFKYAGLGDVDYPPLIIAAKENAKEREVAIQQEEAQKAIRLVQLQADLEAAEAEAKVRITKAEAALNENKIISQSVNQAYLQYRQLEVLEKLAENGNSVFVPYGSLDEVGLSQRMYQQQ